MKAYGRALLFLVAITMAAGLAVVWSNQTSEEASTPDVQSAATQASITQIALADLTSRQAGEVVIEVTGGDEPIRTEELLVTLSTKDSSEALRIG